MPRAMGYCGADSAKLGRVWAGDLGRSEPPLELPVRHGALDPLRTWSPGPKSTLHVPLEVLTCVASIHGLLWQSNLLALTRIPRRRT